jgi:hypothetical protein
MCSSHISFGWGFNTPDWSTTSDAELTKLEDMHRTAAMRSTHGLMEQEDEMDPCERRMRRKYKWNHGARRREGSM